LNKAYVIDNNNLNTISLGKNGLWMGSSKEINLFSNRLGETSGGATVSINSDRILLGLANSNNASTIKLTPEEILLGTGSVSLIETTTGTGVDIKNNSIILATESEKENETIRSGIILDNKGFATFSAKKNTL